MQEFLESKIVISVIISVVAAQVLKVVTFLIAEGQFDTQRLRGTGGMPSSHSASVTALAASVGLQEGFGSTSFAIAGVLAFIVMYDACGIRREAGRHAELLNELVQQWEDSFKDGFHPQKFRTLLGHTLPQVFFGAVLGILISILVYL